MAIERRSLPSRELSKYQAAAERALAKVAQTEDALIEETLGSNSPLRKVDLLLEHLENTCFDSSGRHNTNPKKFKHFRTARVIIREHEKEWRSNVTRGKEINEKSKDRATRKYALDDALLGKYLDLNCMIFENLDTDFAEDLMKIFKANAPKSIRERLQEDVFTDGEVLFSGSTSNGHLSPLGVATRIDGLRLGPRFNATQRGRIGIDLSLHFSESAIKQIYNSPPLPELAAA